MDVARLNMSHGDYSDHEQNYANVRAASAATGRPVGVLADLQGPKIRLGRFAVGRETLEYGATFTITVDDIQGDVNRCSTTFKGLPGDVRPGDAILIDDGRLMLEAIEVTDTDVVTRVVVGGPVSNNKGINLPGVAVSVPAMSDKDCDDLRWALRQGVDMVALSFVRSAKDIEIVHEIMAAEGRKIPVIAKIEKPQAVENLNEIIDAFDAVLHRPAQVLGVLLAHRRNADRHARQVDALVVADRTADHHLGDDVGLGDLDGPQAQPAVVDQDHVAGPDVPGQALVGRRTAFGGA